MLKASHWLTVENESDSLNFSTLKQLILKSAFASACVLLSLTKRVKMLLSRLTSNRFIKDRRAVGSVVTSCSSLQQMFSVNVNEVAAIMKPGT